MKDFLGEVRSAARRHIFYTEHSLEEMNMERELISADEVREAIFKGEIIEDYPNDKRGHSCLMFVWTSQKRPLHIVCSPKETYLGIITVYVPALDKWEENFRIRRKSK